MPPKQKITKEDIVNVAFDIFRKRGMESINARNIANALKCSTQPIFSCFDNMEELRNTLILSARTLYNEYVKNGLKAEKPFKGSGIAYVNFARNEPELFKYLFMSNNSHAVNLDDQIDDNYEQILQTVQVSSGLPIDYCKKLYFEIWIFTHGIASMLATRTVDFSEEKVDELLSDAFVGLLLKFLKEIKENA